LQPAFGIGIRFSNAVKRSNSLNKCNLMRANQNSKPVFRSPYCNGPSLTLSFSSTPTRVVASSFSRWPSCFARGVSWGFSFFRYDLTSLSAIVCSDDSFISSPIDSISRHGTNLPSASNENSIRRLWHQALFSSVLSLK